MMNLPQNKESAVALIQRQIIRCQQMIVHNEQAIEGCQRDIKNWQQMLDAHRKLLETFLKEEE